MKDLRKRHSRKIRLMEVLDALEGKTILETKI